MIELQKINFPVDCIVNHHDFYTYDPLNSFNEEDSLKYLSEDIFQCSFPLDDMVVDLGWYGNIAANKGEFKITIIKNENWEIPFNEIYTKSVEEVMEILTKTIEYLTRAKTKTDDQ